jgi:hypothetical protein
MKEIITHSLFRLALIGAALVIALAISGGAQATEIIGTAWNDRGGEILLTDDKCNSEGRGVIATFPDGRVWIKGCAVPLRPGRVLVEWIGGSSTVIPMSGWAPDATDRSLKSFSDAELDMLIVRTSWFEGKAAQPIPASAPATPPEMRRTLNELTFITAQARLATQRTPQ